MSPEVVSVPDFEFWLALHAKRAAVKLALADYLKKRDFLQMNLNIDILYIVGNHFFPRLTKRYRYSNKAPFGSDQLSKFCHFAQKCVVSIRAFLSRIEGTITKRRLRGINWHP